MHIPVKYELKLEKINGSLRASLMKNTILTSETVTDYLRHSPLPSLEHNLLVLFS